MTQADILVWIVPMTMTMFGAIFLLIHLQTKTALWWSIGYFVLAAAFAVDIVQLSEHQMLKAVAGDALFILALMASTRAISLRYGRPPHDLALVSGFVIAVAVIAAVLHITGSVSAELIASHLTCAGLQLFAGFQMRGRISRGIDRVIFALTMLIAADLLLRTAAFNLILVESISFESWRNSDFAFAFQTSSSLLGLLFAFAALYAIGLDVIASLQLRAQTDALTGLLNRGGFGQRAAELRAAARPGTAVAVVLADIDHFKRVNDEFGHAAGDAVIADFAQTLRRLAGKEGCVGRLGGEEFAVLLKGADIAAATSFAEAVRAAFAAPQPGGTLCGRSLTASFGVTELSSGEALEEALNQADQRLYRAKRAGRNRGVGAAPAEPLAAAA